MTNKPQRSEPSGRVARVVRNGQMRACAFVGTVSVIVRSRPGYSVASGAPPLADTALCAAMGVAAQPLVRERLFVVRKAADYCAIYRAVLDRGQRPAQGLAEGVGVVAE